MSEWVSRPDMEELIGREATEQLCEALGGVPFYVPIKPKSDIELAKIVGFGRACALCEAFGGAYITVPLGNRPEPYKVRIMRLIDEGKTPPQIARALGTTERYVRTILSRYQRKPRQLTFF